MDIFVNAEKADKPPRQFVPVEDVEDGETWETCYRSLAPLVLTEWEVG